MCDLSPGTLWKLCFRALLDIVCGLGGELCWAAGAGEGSGVPTVLACLNQVQTVLKGGKKRGKIKETQVLLWAGGG